MPTAVTDAAPATPTRRAARRVRVAGLVALGGLLAWAIAGLPFLVFPATGPLPQHADVVLVLGGETTQRIATAERLLRAGTVSEMLWSTPPQPGDPIEPVVQHDCRVLAHLTCFVPDPSTTQGEARELRAQATAHRWTSAIVVTQNAHVARARMIVARCFSGSLTMAESGEPPYGGWAWQYLYQTLATVKAWLHPGC